MNILNRIRQQKLFSTVYVLGTAVSVASVMLAVIYMHVNASDLYPAANRHRTYTLDHVVQKAADGDEPNSGGLSDEYTERLIDLLGDDAVVSVHRFSWGPSFEVSPFGDPLNSFPVTSRRVDPNYFRIVQLEFVEGKPFTPDDMEAARPVVVISDNFARRVFGTAEGVIGREFRLGDTSVTVAGVVREVSFLMPYYYTQVYLPNTALLDPDDSGWGSDCVGSNKLTIMTDDYAKVEAAVKEIQRQHDASATDGHYMWIPNGVRSEVRIAGGDSHLSPWRQAVHEFWPIIVALILIPALNLSGLIAGTMDARLSEMGIRKAFGARRGTLLRQLIAENVALSTLGGTIGLILAWIGIAAWKDWFFFGTQARLNIPDGVELTLQGDMLFAPVLFVAAFLACMTLNVLSALIPAWWSLRRPIVSSLNDKL